MRACPHCGHRRFRPSKRRTPERLLTAWLPLRPFRCQSPDCGRRFWRSDWTRREPATLGRTLAVVLALVALILAFLYANHLPYSSSPTADPPAAVDSTAVLPDASTPAAVVPEAAAPEAVPATPSRGPRLLDAGITSTDDGFTLTLTTDRPPQYWSVDPLDAPPRLQIDLLGPWTTHLRSIPPFESRRIVGTTIDPHEDLLRITLVLRQPIQEPTVTVTEQGLQVLVKP